MMIHVSTEEEEKHAKSEAEMQAKTMQLNVVRLCFQAYLQDNQGQIIQVLPSQISNPIFDSSKSVLIYILLLYLIYSVLEIGEFGRG